MARIEEGGSSRTVPPIIAPFIPRNAVWGPGGYYIPDPVRPPPRVIPPPVTAPYTPWVVPAGAAGGPATPIPQLTNIPMPGGPGTMGSTAAVIQPNPPDLGDYGLRHPVAPLSFAELMRQFYLRNPRAAALSGHTGTNQPNTAFEDLYGRSGLGQGLAVAGIGFVATHGPRVPTPQQIWEQRSGIGTRNPRGYVYHTTTPSVTPGQLTPWYEPPKPEDKPVLRGYSGGPGGGGWSGEGGGWAGTGGGTTRGGGYGSGLTNWRIGY